ncbi:hypothetical protein LOTGIDRAFT_159094 [Lottia gigantea]|uniref:Uncharacterized protein n=1 Tax=Lottia gigantea TaxID=225164 RepID=V4AXJ5_LOTGI|nr:hypothetical protein LOTGIDRAFT_159094 [Lottia gigantea]ESO98296.1 hypothetical protein LOTGIDRAFT_159094 [Lottia gigantea]
MTTDIAKGFQQTEGLHSWNDHSGSLGHQQRYLEKLQKHKTDILAYDHEYQKEFGRRVASFQKSRRGDNHLGSLSTSDSRKTSRMIKHQPFFQIEMSQTPRHAQEHLKLPRDPRYYAVNKRHVRTERLQPISKKRKCRETKYSDDILKSQLQRLDTRADHQTFEGTVHILPNISHTPRNTPISTGNIGYTTLHRLSTRFSRDSSPSKSPLKEQLSPKSPLLQREKTDFEPFEAIIERNQLNIDDYFKLNDDISDSDDEKSRY